MEARYSSQMKNMRIYPLTIENCPDFISIFFAPNWEAAFQLAQQCLQKNSIQSAVWLRDSNILSETFNIESRKAYDDFITRHPGSNFMRKDEEFILGSSGLLPYLSQDELNAASVFREHADLRVIQRIQVKTRKETAMPHFDGWSDDISLDDNQRPYHSGRAFGGRRIRVLDNYAGAGPILYERPSKIVIRDSNNHSDDGYLKNTRDLRRAFQAPDISVTFLTRVQEWGCQAVLHGSPEVKASSANPRRQTVFDLIF